MNRTLTIEQVISNLEAFQPGPTETDSVCNLYEILEGIESMPNNMLAVPSLFNVLERNVGSDFGSPGPIVHALEAIAPYSKLLAESIKRQPTFYTIQMVGAILNSELTIPDRKFWLNQLRDVISHPRSTPYDHDRAREILERHEV